MIGGATLGGRPMDTPRVRRWQQQAAHAMGGPREGGARCVTGWTMVVSTMVNVVYKKTTYRAAVARVCGNCPVLYMSVEP